MDRPRFVGSQNTGRHSRELPINGSRPLPNVDPMNEKSLSFRSWDADSWDACFWVEVHGVYPSAETTIAQVVVLVIAGPKKMQAGPVPKCCAHHLVFLILRSISPLRAQTHTFESTRVKTQPRYRSQCAGPPT